MPKLLYLHQYFKFPSQRGSTRSYDLATSFVKNGIEVVIISSSKNPKYKAKRWNVVYQDGLEVHFIFSSFGSHISYFKRTFIFLKFMWFATFRVLHIKADIVLATSTPLTIGIPAMIKKWLDKTPYIFEVRDVWPEAVIAIGAVKNKLTQRWLYFQEKVIYKYADYIVPLSSDMQRSIVRRFPDLKDKVDVVIENISEVDRFQSPLAAPIDLEKVLGVKPSFSILYAGTFGRVNGIDYVIDLAVKTLLHDPKLVYILIGAGKDKEKITSLAKQVGVLNRNVFIIDPISKNELPGWYKSVDMGSSFVIDIKELWANSANKFFDSLAAGKPILINHRGWQSEVIAEENVGYVLPPQLNDVDIHKFVAYTRDRVRQNAQSIRALSVAKSWYSLEVATSKYMWVFGRFCQDWQSVPILR